MFARVAYEPSVNLFRKQNGVADSILAGHTYIKESGDIFS